MAYDDVLNKAIEIFAFSGEEAFEEVISKGLMPIAEAVGFDCASIYGYKDTSDGRRLGQLYRWDKISGGLTCLTEGLASLPSNNVAENWLENLKGGKHIFRRWSDMNDDEKRFMGSFGVCSIFLSPIFISGQFWGQWLFKIIRKDWVSAWAAPAFSVRRPTYPLPQS